MISLVVLGSDWVLTIGTMWRLTQHLPVQNGPLFVYCFFLSKQASNPNRISIGAAYDS